MARKPIPSKQNSPNAQSFQKYINFIIPFLPYLPSDEAIPQIITSHSPSLIQRPPNSKVQIQSGNRAEVGL
jgi:hypothetical protein